MLGKVHTPQTNEAEHFVLKVFEKLNFINLKEDKLITRPRIFVPDFILQYKNQKYCLEVKLNFVISFLSKTITNFSHLLKQNDYYGIIVILDKVPQDFKDLIKEDYNITIYDISNILYLIGDNEELQNDLKKVISFSLNDIIPERVDFNKTIESLPKTKTNYILELENIKEGKEGASEYETFLEKIIKEIFSDELMLFKTQYRTEDNLNIFDMICKIKNETKDDFFNMIEKFYQTKYILFEFKNYQTVIKQGEICSTEKYLYATALRKVAIIFSRHGIDHNGQKLINGILRESGKLIIVLSDNDLKEMLTIYEKGDKASIILTKKIDQILTTLEK